jgi:hypothetical protein
MNSDVRGRAMTGPPDPNYREHMRALAECWEAQPALMIPCSQQLRAGEIASWIRKLLNDDAELREARKTIYRLKRIVESMSDNIEKGRPLPRDEDRELIAGLQQGCTRLSTELAKSEREVRDTALDRDRWQKRARELEAEIKSAGISKSKQYQHNNSRDHGNQAEQIGI